MFHQTVLKAWHEVDDALSSYRAAIQACALLLVKPDRTKRDGFLAGVRAGKGMTSDLPNLDAQAVALRIQRDLAQAQAQRNIALVSLYKALGDDDALGQNPN